MIEYSLKSIFVDELVGVLNLLILINKSQLQYKKLKRLDFDINMLFIPHS
ncbi:MAG: hypothetical protein JG782_1046 [Anaerophaga sp.]|nr:hypothetical protein [Anaerophaga sp.]MDI3521374.1 hypothetical protein [Anaerophaga sp.]MDK2841197.1 hypothetical protein [Anaerophaga sp.]MDN5290656.1 hypothetical protein [Anaerophaga sp.]